MYVERVRGSCISQSRAVWRFMVIYTTTFLQGLVYWYAMIPIRGETKLSHSYILREGIPDVWRLIDVEVTTGKSCLADTGPAGTLAGFPAEVYVHMGDAYGAVFCCRASKAPCKQHYWVGWYSNSDGYLSAGVRQVSGTCMWSIGVGKVCYLGGPVFAIPIQYLLWVCYFCGIW